MPELNVSRKTISSLFSEMRKRKFIVPEYQRPYKWDFEKCETLWRDITDFAEREADNDSEYFLGTIVTNSVNNNLEIIDGQQRITSLFLLLRAFYSKLEGMNEDKDVEALKAQIAPCIWDTNPINKTVDDYSLIHLISLVATDNDNDALHSIVKFGRINNNARDNYSKNYSYFVKFCNDYASQNPLSWKMLLVTILTRCILLPIECDTPETALTIFSTLNDRGMPLSDSDIFKAQIYRSLDSEEKKSVFNSDWKELSLICESSVINIDDVFRYYSHQLRARDRITSREEGLRKFYTANDNARLLNVGLMDDLLDLARFWNSIYDLGDYIYNDVNLINTNAKKWIHCLTHYPNDFWKYPVSVFFINNKEKEDFELNFEILLRKIVSFLFVNFIDIPSVNKIKDPTYALCVSIANNEELKFNQAIITDSIEFRAGISNNSRSKLSKGLVLLYSYINNEQVELIPKNFEVEHILPLKWQNTNYQGWTREDASETIELFGNKVTLEKKLNIQAGNGYFGRKKEKYKESQIVEARILSEYKNDDWSKESIKNRNKLVIDSVIAFFNSNVS